MVRRAGGWRFWYREVKRPGECRTLCWCGEGSRRARLGLGGGGDKTGGRGSLEK